MLSSMEPGRITSPVASARPATVKAACKGLRSMLRSAMRKPGVKPRVSPMRSSSEGEKSTGGSGRMASAGGSLTACQTTLATPTMQAPALTAKAVPSAL